MLLLFQCLEVSLPSDKAMNNSPFNAQEEITQIQGDSSLDSSKRLGQKRRYLSTNNGNSKLTTNCYFHLIHIVFKYRLPFQL